jgi:hypothetical protein
MEKTFTQKVNERIDNAVIYLQRDRTKMGNTSAVFGALFSYFTIASESIRETTSDPATKVLFAGFTVTVAGFAAFYSGYAAYNWKKSWSELKTLLKKRDSADSQKLPLASPG